ncbi:MAG: endonuclease/exonuclease/phosphatase family metal-dependent hydrolase [Planctomycetota bacterium]|jgi:endonuclease/exonuclease/phosphatase family metal-dependent hydrolase
MVAMLSQQLAQLLTYQPIPMHNLLTSRTRPLRSLMLGPLLLAAMAASSVDSSAQTLEDLSFGTEATFDLVTWNIEWFPKNGQASIDAVKEVIEALDADLLALQEITDTAILQQLVDDLPGYDTFYQSSWFAGLAFVYNSSTIQVQATYEIYTTQPYWSPFPRSPVVMELKFKGEDVVVINNHFKCCGDGFLDLSDPNDEENRRLIASNLLKSYIDTNHPDTRVLLVGDLNDILSDQPSDNVFQSFLNEPSDYAFADSGIATGSSSDWSYPGWPSHLDHVLITNELFAELASASGAIETIHIEDYLPGGWSQYEADISDHRPVGIRLPVGDAAAACSAQIQASELIRLGTPANSLAFLPTAGFPPIVGQVWAPNVFHTIFQPSASLDLIFITTGAANLPSPLGTILCDLSSTTFSFSKSPSQAFAIPIPAICSLTGLYLYTQVASIAGSDVKLTNGLDIRIGTL